MPKWPSGFHYFLQFRSEFGNKEFMIWATVSSRSCFCWLYKASPSLAAKNIINLNSILTIWRCPCVVFSCVLGRGCLLWPVRSLGIVSPWSASFCATEQKPNVDPDYTTEELCPEIADIHGQALLCVANKRQYGYPEISTHCCCC